MSPDQISTILRSIERLDGKIDAQGEAIHKVANEVTETKVIAKQAHAEIRKTNGRVNRIEDREAEARGEAKAERRHVEDDEKSSEKWRNIGPTVIASVIGGLTVGGVLLIVTLIVTGQP